MSTNTILGHISRLHIKCTCLLSLLKSVTIPHSFLVFLATVFGGGVVDDKPDYLPHIKPNSLIVKVEFLVE